MENTSFEDIRQIIRETVEIQKENTLKFKETDLKFKELFEAQRETDLKFKETDLKFKELFEAQRETDLKFKETDLRFKKTEELVDKVCEKLGNIDTNIGYAAEAYFQTALAKSLMFANLHFDEVILNLKKKRKGASCEFDIVMVNHEAIAIIEVKHRIHPSLPEEMATKKVAQFRTFFPEYKNYMLYLGLAGLSMDEVALENARNFGIGVLKQDGDTIESFDVPLKVY